MKQPKPRTYVPKPLRLCGESTLSPEHYSRKIERDAPKARYDRKTVNLVGARYAANRNSQDAEQLLVFFNAMLNGYCLLICKGLIPSGPNRQYHQFLALFGKDHTAAAERLHLALQAGWAADDVFNELALMLLQVASRFDGRGSFTGYLSSRFKYEVSDWLHKCQNDATNYTPLFDATWEEQERQDDEEDNEWN